MRTTGGKVDAQVVIARLTIEPVCPPAACNHRVIATAAEQSVAPRVACDQVAQGIAGHGDIVVIVDNGQVLDVRSLGRHVKGLGGLRLQLYQIVPARVGHQIQRAVDNIDIVASPPEQGIITAQPIECIIARGSDNHVVERVACPMSGAIGQSQMFDVLLGCAAQGPIDRRLDQIKAVAIFHHNVQRIVDAVGVVAILSDQVVDASAAHQQVRPFAAK